MVNIDPAYDTDQRAAIAAAFTNWNASRFATGNCSAVVFQTPTYSSTPIAGPGINPTNINDFRFQVYKQNPPGSPTDRGFTEGSANAAGRQFHTWSYLNTAVTVPEALKQLMAHEIGHTFGLGECVNCGSSASLMNGPVSSYNNTNGLSSPTTCDNAAAKSVRPYICPTATPTPTPPPPSSCPDGFCAGYTTESAGTTTTCSGSPDLCFYPNNAGCPPGSDDFGQGCCCQIRYTSPVLIDVAGNGFRLTDGANGVNFDHNATGTREKLS